MSYSARRKRRAHRQVAEEDHALAQRQHQVLTEAGVADDRGHDAQLVGAAASAPLGWQRLLHHHQREDEQGDRQRREDPEQSPPRREAEHLAAEERSEDGGEHGDHRQLRVEAGGRRALRQVTHRGARGDDAPGAEEALEEPRDQEHLDRRRECAQGSGQGEQGDADEGGPAPSVAVAEPSDDQLAQGEAGEAERHRRRRGRVAGVQRPGDVRETGQVQVRREGTHRGQQTQGDGGAQPDPGRPSRPRGPSRPGRSLRSRLHDLGSRPSPPVSPRRLTAARPAG